MRRRAGLILADDNPAMLERARGIVTPEFEILGTAADGQAALDLIERLEPELAVLDISMPVFGGLAVAATLAERGPIPRIVFLTVLKGPAYISRALSTGALGYVIKSRMDQDLCLAVRKALEGRSFVSPCLSLAD